MRALIDLFQEPGPHLVASEVPRDHGAGVVRSWRKVGNQEAQAQRSHREVNQSQSAPKVGRSRPNCGDALVPKPKRNQKSHASGVIDEPGGVVAEVHTHVVCQLLFAMSDIGVVLDLGARQGNDGHGFEDVREVFGAANLLKRERVVSGKLEAV